MSSKSPIVAAGLAVLLILGACSSPSPARAPQHPAVVLLEMPDGGRGSGVVIAPEWVLTCLHCGAAELAGGLPVASLHPAPGGDVDMALMYVPGLTAEHYVPIAGAPARLHDPISAYGFHLGKQFLRTDGYQGSEVEEMSAPIIHGCSGGAVVNRDGALLGVITWVRYTGTANGWDGYALPHMSGYTPITDAIRVWIAETI